MKSKLTNRQKIAIRDAEENSQPKRKFFHGRKQHYYVYGYEVEKDIWLKHLSSKTNADSFTLDQIKQLAIG